MAAAPESDDGGFLRSDANPMKGGILYKSSGFKENTKKFQKRFIIITKIDIRWYKKTKDDYGKPKGTIYLEEITEIRDTVNTKAAQQDLNAFDIVTPNRVLTLYSKVSAAETDEWREAVTNVLPMCSILKRGTLVKKAGKGKLLKGAWDKRFYLLRSDRLSYFANEKAVIAGDAPRGVVRFSNVTDVRDTTVPEALKDDRAGFDLVTKDRVYTFYSAAGGDDSRQLADMIGGLCTNLTSSVGTDTDGISVRSSVGGVDDADFGAPMQRTKTVSQIMTMSYGGSQPFMDELSESSEDDDEEPPPPYVGDDEVDAEPSAPPPDL